MHVRRSSAGRGPGRSGRATSGLATSVRAPSARSRRVLAGALAVTAVVAVVGVSGAAGLEPVRGAAATVLGPLERLLGPGDDEVSAARAEQAALATRLAAAQREVAALHAGAAISATSALAGARLVPARVVAVGASGPAGPQRVTIDAGSRDGVEVDRTVVAAAGLVGRVVSVAPWTSDVLLVGSADLTVGVRVGPRGVLGEASGAALAGGARPEPGLLSFALVDRGAATVGDVVTTLGSVGDRPYVPGIPVGRVTTVDLGAGRLAPSGTVTPAVDTTSLDVVAVVLTTGRGTPRPAVTGSG
jgi:rod shape-determining protein MreC